MQTQVSERLIPANLNLPDTENPVAVIQHRRFRNACGGYLGIRVEIALCQYQGQTLFSGQVALNGGAMADILCDERHVKQNVCQIFLFQFRPVSRESILFRQCGNPCRVQIASCRDGDMHLIVIRKAEGYRAAAQQLRQCFLCKEICLGQRLCLGVIADSVNAAKVFPNHQIGIPGKGQLDVLQVFFGVTQNCADIFLCVIDFHHSKAIRCHGCAACNTAHISLAGHGASCGAAPDKPIALAGNSAHVLGIGKANCADISALLYQSKGLAAGDTAAVALFHGDKSTVFTIHNHASDFAFKVQRAFTGDFPIGIDIQVILHGHSTGNAAHISVSQYAAKIRAAFHFSGQVDFRVQIGHILDAAAQRVGCVVQGGGHGIDLLLQGADIAGKLCHGSVDGGTHALHRLLHTVQTAADSVLRGLDGIAVREAGVFGVGHQQLQRFLCLLHMTLKLACLRRDGAARVLYIGGCLVDRAAHILQLALQNLQQVLLVFNEGNRLHLADDTAHLFTALDMTCVFTIHHIAVLGACDTANVVAHVLIAHIACVLAGTDHATAGTGNAAHIGNGVCLLGVGQAAQCHIRKIHLILLGGCVDGSKIFTVPGNAVVLPGDAADKMRSLNNTPHFASLDDAADPIDAGNTADHIVAGHFRFCNAVLNQALVAAGDGADFIPAAGRVNSCGDRNIPHNGGFRQVAEQALGRSVLCDKESGDGVTLAVKGSAEDRDAVKGSSGQVNVTA